MKIKFENGPFEKRYNLYWNGCVVRTDNALRDNLTFFSANPETQDNMISVYIQHIMNILNNLYRQLPMFSDPEYVENYIRLTQAQAVDDLLAYKSFLAKSRGDLSLINKCIYVVYNLDAFEGEEEKKGNQP
jgi:hypothetical protein